MDFVGSGAPIDDQGFASAIAAIGVEDTALWSVLTVETSGCGFQLDRRPKILFERHIFSRLTQGAYDADHPDISAPTPGGYGQSGAFQYDRLAVALSLDETAALQSASWGMGQILGTNYKSAGFADVRTMVDQFVKGENEQLQGMAAFIKSNSTMRSGPLTHGSSSSSPTTFRTSRNRGLCTLRSTLSKIWPGWMSRFPG